MTPNHEARQGTVVRSFSIFDEKPKDVASNMHKTILIGVAGFAGTLLRYWLVGLVARSHGETFPWGTIVVNLVGCLITGVVFNVTEETLLINSTIRTVIMIGLLGGFTTFSAYGLQTFMLLREGQLGWAVLNVAVSNVVGLFMVWAGYSLTKAL
jgi:CrcB protein